MGNSASVAFDQESPRQGVPRAPENTAVTMVAEPKNDNPARDQTSPKPASSSSSAASGTSTTAAGAGEKGDNEDTEESRDKFREEMSDDEDGSIDEDDIEPVEVLLQFIPYYGQGDPSNDSIVRATLSALSVEDIDSKDEFGNTLLLLACQYRCEDLVRMMLNKGADPNAVNSSGACCLHFACYRESASFQVAKVLLQSGANPDVAESTYGCTPLHYCAGTGDIKFCKLLLSYGAQIASRDYYNYTCVDYAKEAQMVEVEKFLRSHYDKAQSSALGRTNASMLNLTATSSGKDLSVYADISQWELHKEQSTDSVYYMHSTTGEVLWESDLQSRIEAYKTQQAKGDAKDAKQGGEQAKSSSNNSSSSSSSSKKRDPPPQHVKTPPCMIEHAMLQRLIAFLTTHDPARLTEIQALLQKYSGRESVLLKDLCEQYKVEEEGELKEFEKSLQAMKKQLPSSSASSSSKGANPPPSPDKAAAKSSSSSSSSNSKGGPPPDPKAAEAEKIKLQAAFDQEKRNIRKEYEKELEGEKGRMKKKIQEYLEEEKNKYMREMSEMKGAIVHLKGDLETAVKAKGSVEDELKALRNSMDKVSSSDGERLEMAEKEIAMLRKEIQTVSAQHSAAEDQLSIEREKLRSLELAMDMTMSNLTTGNAQKVAADLAAAEERAKAQQEKDNERAAALQDIEAKAQREESRLKTELSMAKAELARVERSLREDMEALKKTKDSEIEQLRADLTATRSEATVELSAANMQVADLHKRAEQLQKLADEATSTATAAQHEIAEGRIIHKQNAQLHQDLLREQMQRKKLHNEIEDMKGKIRVYVRVRPFSKSEAAKNCTEAVIKDSKTSVMVKGVGAPDAKKTYEFDTVFGGPVDNSQTDVFKDTKHLMMSVLDGYNVCIFAYGQTGAGKSFTMIGAADMGTSISPDGEFDELAGIMPRAVSEVFRLINERTAQMDFVVELQMFQLYKDGLEDLLKDKPGKASTKSDEKEKPLKITLAEHSSTGLVQIEGSVTRTATTAQEVMKIFAAGATRRTVASTQMNAESSRSHLICTLTVTLTNKKTEGVTTGKLTLVDLAGSERLDKSGAVGENLKEAQSINKSLSALGDVIAGLTTGQTHIPYRNHPLTMMMSDSIGGNAKTLMFVNTSPADYNSAESDSSLKFAMRCKDITNTATAGAAGGANAGQLKALKSELAKMKKGAGGAAGQLSGLRRP